ncbi:MAG TPA: hypothetical protein VFJ51_06055, partial [Nitrososphaeraceae archaeon]|nr:hypothetical protein [Nitrososphaeraceae archaeon]
MPASKQQHQLVLWRRGQVMELVAKGHSQAEISDILKVDRSVICRDITYLNMQAKENIRTFI